MILLDVQMPGMNGFETAQMIKSRERTKFIPIIFLTAISKDEEYVFEGYSVGAVDYMFKPFQPEILRSKVNVFVELYLQADVASPSRSSDCTRASARSSSSGTCASSSQSEARFREIVSIGDGRDRCVRRGRQHHARQQRGRSECSERRAAAAIGKDVDAVLPERRGARTSRRVSGECRRRRRATPASRAPASSFTARPDQRRNVSARGVGFVPRWSDRKRRYTIIARDVSERIRHEEELERQAASLAESAKRAHAAQRGAAPATGRSRARDDGAQPFLRVDEPRAAHAHQRRARLQHSVAREASTVRSTTNRSRASSGRRRPRVICSSW